MYFASVNRRNFNEFNLHKITRMFVRVCMCLRIFIDVSRLCRYFFPLVFNQCKCTVEFTINTTVCILLWFRTSGYTRLSKVLFHRAFSRNWFSRLFRNRVGNCDNSTSETSGKSSFSWRLYIIFAKYVFEKMLCILVRQVHYWKKYINIKIYKYINY